MVLNSKRPRGGVETVVDFFVYSNNNIALVFLCEYTKTFFKKADYAGVWRSEIAVVFFLNPKMTAQLIICHNPHVSSCL